jgi:hypothetical protein
MSENAFSDADLAYLRANYFTLEELCAGRADSPEEVRALVRRGLLPAPSYVLDDRTELFPADYFVLVDQARGPRRLRRHFESRHRAAGGDPAVLGEDWQGYIDGVYGVCLRQVLPETIVRKGELVASLERLLADPEPGSSDWQAQLRLCVWELDALEREFAPDYDRGARFGGPPTRDRLIAAARDRNPGLFGVEMLAR